MNKGNIGFLLGVLIGVPVLYKLIMWLITDYNLSPMALTAVIVYVIIVYPQYTALHGLKIVNAMQTDDYEFPKADKSNWIIFWNDFNLAQYFGSDSTLKLITNLLFKLSIPLLIISTLYMNLVIAFYDLGLTATVVIAYVQTVSLVVYLVTKSIILGYFLYMFKGMAPAIVGILHPIGFMLLTSFVKHYLNSLEDVQNEGRLGLEYE